MAAATKSPSDRCPACGRRHKRRNPQNALYWLLLHKMAEKRWPEFDDNGEPTGGTVLYSADSFHRYYASKYLGSDDIAMPNGKTLQIPRSTSALDVAEFGEYFDAVQADANERGVWLDE